MLNGEDNPVRLVSPAGNDAAERRGLMLRMMAIADLGTDHEGGPIRVDRDSFAELFERLAPRVDVEAPDRVGSGKTTLACSFTVQSMDGLHPDSIVQEVPVLRSLVDARELLEKCLAHEVEFDDVRERLVEVFSGTDLSQSLGNAAARPPARAETPGSGPVRGADAGSLDALLERVEIPGSAEDNETAASLVDLLSAVVSPGSKKTDRPHLEGLIRQIDLRLSRQVAAIQGQPSFLELEAAWRGLKFLVGRLDFRAGVQLDVLPATRGEFLDRFFEHAFHDEYEGRSEVPLGFVLADFGFGRTVPDLEMVQGMARLGESLSVPFVAAMDPSFWGVRQAHLLNKLPDLMQKAQGSEYAKWNRLRSEPGSLWVFLAANRFLLRPGWADAYRPPQRFTWSLQDEGEKPVWGSAVWAMGAALGQAFAEAGIRFPCVGPSSAGVLDDLPVLQRTEGSAESYTLPLEIDLPDQRAFQLSQSGFAPLVSRRDSDVAYFNLVPSFHKPKRYDNEEATRASFLAATLPFRGFAGAVAHELDRIGRRIGGGSSPEEISDKVRQSMLGMLSPMEEGEPKPEAIQVDVDNNPDEPSLLDVTVRLQPGFHIYGGPVDLVVGTSVPR